MLYIIVSLIIIYPIANPIMVSILRPEEMY